MANWSWNTHWRDGSWVRISKSRRVASIETWAVAEIRAWTIELTHCAPQTNILTRDWNLFIAVSAIETITRCWHCHSSLVATDGVWIYKPMVAITSIPLRYQSPSRVMVQRWLSCSVSSSNKLRLHSIVPDTPTAVI